MNFALCPDDGYPRIWRFVPDADLPGLVCSLDYKMNILTINRDLFEQLNEVERTAVLKTKAAAIRATPVAA